MLTLSASETMITGVGPPLDPAEVFNCDGGMPKSVTSTIRADSSSLTPMAVTTMEITEEGGEVLLNKDDADDSIIFVIVVIVLFCCSIALIIVAIIDFNNHRVERVPPTILC